MLHLREDVQRKEKKIITFFDFGHPPILSLDNVHTKAETNSLKCLVFGPPLPLYIENIQR